MKVLYFGTYQRDYPRNAQVISCLRRAGVEVVERHEPVWEGARDAWSAGAGAAARLLRAEGRLLRRRPPGGFDVILVGYPGQLDVPAARRAARGTPVVLNPLVSLWETFVGDRERFGPRSLAGRALRRIDRAALRGVDLVVADTEANAAFLAVLAGLPRDRVASIFVGAEERLFGPPWEPREPPVFVGKLIPLHGLETILAAARRRPSLRLRIVGSGQLEPLLSTRPANVEWVPWVPYDRLPELLRASAAALGVFGRGEKAARVIPNKAFQALACGTPVVTADTPAARELLVDGESALLVPPGDPEALASALERLTTEPETAARVSEGGLRAYRERASEEVLGARWRTLLESL